MTVQNGQWRDGGKEDAAGQPPDFRYSGHHQKRGQRYPRTRRDCGKDGGWTADGRRMGGCGGTMPRMDNLKW